MTDAEYVSGLIETEGFDYSFRFYSNFEEIKDPEFHELRKKYVEAANALENYIDEEAGFNETT